MDFAYSTDQENYDGRYDSAEQAVVTGFGENEDADSIWVGECESPACASHLDADLLLDHILCQDDYNSEWADGTLAVSKEAREDLTGQLQAMFEAWLTKWKAHPTFYTIPDPKEWTREEAVEAGLVDAQKEDE